jgi:hypothetical protein
MEFLLTLALLGQGTVPGPTGVELEKLWDISVQLPGTTEPLTLNPGAPVPCGDGVVFRAKEFSVPMSWAYHVTSTSLEVFVDEETIIPGTSETFAEIADMQCSGNGVYSFIGLAEEPVPGGAFSGSPGSLTLIQSNGVAVDGNDIRLWGQASASEIGAALLGLRNPPFLGTALVMKPAGGDPMYVADFSTILPGQTEPGDSYDSPRMMGSGFVFRAQAPQQAQGLYRWTETEGFSLLVDNSTPVPGFPGTFAGVGRIAVLDFGVAFSAGFSGGLGIFLVDHQGEIEPFILPGDMTVEGETLLAAFIPKGKGRFVAFGGVTDATAPREGVFARTPDGSIYRIVAEGDIVDGKPADRVFYDADDRSVALRFDTHPPDPADFDQRVYRVTFGDTAVPVEIPALSFRGQALLILLIVLFALWTVRHRKLRTTE